jgi:hypothetical protein
VCALLLMMPLTCEQVYFPQDGRDMVRILVQCCRLEMKRGSSKLPSSVESGTSQVAKQKLESLTDNGVLVTSVQKTMAQGRACLAFPNSTCALRDFQRRIKIN